MIVISCDPKFKKTHDYFNKIKKTTYNMALLDKYGKRGVEALSAATPKDSGLTASSWTYTITKGKDVITIDWHNTNFNDGVPIAIILQYGHATKNGGYVKGIDYINPAMAPLFKELADEAWKEVKG